MLKEGGLLLLLLQRDDTSLLYRAAIALAKLHLLSCVEQAIVIGARAKVAHCGARLHLLSAAIPHVNLRRRMSSFALGAHIARRWHHV